MDEQVRAFLASLETRLAYSPSTRLAYENDIHRFVEFLEGSLQRPAKLEDFNADQVASFLDHERQDGRRPSTLLRRRASLRRFASFLRQQYPGQPIAFDPHSPVVNKAISGMALAQKPHALSQSQIDALWSMLESSNRPRARRDQAILALLLESGLTVGTLIGLNLPDVNIVDCSLRLRTENSHEVWAPLGSAAAPLDRYLKDGRPELNYLPEEPALFISQTGGRMSRQGVWQVLRQWGRRARLPVTLSPRLIRHTAALRMWQSGRPLIEIQSLLGHSNMLSTQALLRRLSASMQEEMHA